MERDDGKFGIVAAGEGDPVASLVPQQGHRFAEQWSDQQLTGPIATDLAIIAEHLRERDIRPPAQSAVRPGAGE